MKRYFAIMVLIMLLLPILVKADVYDFEYRKDKVSYMIDDDSSSTISEVNKNGLYFLYKCDKGECHPRDWNMVVSFVYLNGDTQIDTSVDDDHTVLMFPMQYIYDTSLQSGYTIDINEFMENVRENKWFEFKTIKEIDAWKDKKVVNSFAGYLEDILNNKIDSYISSSNGKYAISLNLASNFKADGGTNYKDNDRSPTSRKYTGGSKGLYMVVAFCTDKYYPNDADGDYYCHIKLHSRDNVLYMGDVPMSKEDIKKILDEIDDTKFTGDENKVSYTKKTFPNEYLWTVYSENNGKKQRMTDLYSFACESYHGNSGYWEDSDKDYLKCCDSDNIGEINSKGNICTENGWKTPDEYCTDNVAHPMSGGTYFIESLIDGNIGHKDGRDGCCGDDVPNIEGKFERCVRSSNDCNSYLSESECPTDNCEWKDNGKVDCSNYEVEECAEDGPPDYGRCRDYCSTEGINKGCEDNDPYGCSGTVTLSDGTCVANGEIPDCSSYTESECKSDWFCKPEYYTKTSYNDFNYIIHKNDNDYLCTGTMNTDTGEVTDWHWEVARETTPFEISTVKNMKNTGDYMNNKPDVNKKEAIKEQQNFLRYCDNTDQKSENTRFYLCDLNKDTDYNYLFSGDAERIIDNNNFVTLYDFIMKSDSLKDTCTSETGAHKANFQIEKSFFCFKENEHTSKILECSSSYGEKTVNKKRTRTYGDSLYSFAEYDDDNKKMTTEFPDTNGIITITPQEKLEANDNDYLAFDVKVDEDRINEILTNGIKVTVKTTDDDEYTAESLKPLYATKDYMHFVMKIE